MDIKRLPWGTVLFRSGDIGIVFESTKGKSIVWIKSGGMSDSNWDGNLSGKVKNLGVHKELWQKLANSFSDFAEDVPYE